ncbi:MAG: hypothetical protein GY715_10200 [Planctomycetes bacterium]|nr:hypothetical protein [Planctomycetota bacterium]
MAIQTRLQTRFVVQRLFAVVICLVLGLWGVYDYMVKIPAQTRAHARGQVFPLVKAALEAPLDSPTRMDTIKTAVTVVQEAQAELLDITLDQNLTREQLLAAIEGIKESTDQQWLAILAIFKTALAETAQRTATQPPTDAITLAFKLAEAGNNAVANIPPPGGFDRATQWMFMLCLPFAPYFLWGLLQARRRSFRLDDDGTLHAPGETWPREEIDDIDMGRWMAKSVAWVVHTDGRRLKLDDYLHRNVHLIVGALASERYPREWDAEAKRLGAGEEEGEGDAPAAPAEHPAEASTPEG